jgi:hypothetical protein
MERRNRLYTGWDAQLRERDAAEAERKRRAMAMEQFQGLEAENRPQLQ